MYMVIVIVCACVHACVCVFACVSLCVRVRVCMLSALLWHPHASICLSSKGNTALLQFS